MRGLLGGRREEEERRRGTDVRKDGKGRRMFVGICWELRVTDLDMFALSEEGGEVEFVSSHTLVTPPKIEFQFQ